MQYEWANYETAVKQILENSDFGFVVVCESGDDLVGFVAFTFEWSDWRDGAFFWLQGLQVAESSDKTQVLQSLKAALETHKATLDYRCSGIRLCSPKVIHDESEEAIKMFELQPSHYYVYHVDTA